MKLYYQTATGKEQVEVPEEWFNTVMQMNKKEKNKRTVARRHEVSVNQFKNANGEAFDLYELFAYYDKDIERISGGGDDTSERVRQVLSAMKPKQAELLELLYCDGFSQRELAQAVGVTPSAICQRVKCAKVNFKRLWESRER